MDNEQIQFHLHQIDHAAFVQDCIEDAIKDNVYAPEISVEWDCDSKFTVTVVDFEDDWVYTANNRRELWLVAEEYTKYPRADEHTHNPIAWAYAA